MIQFSCPNCQKVLKAPDEKAGVTVRCPQCKQPLSVPSPVAINPSPTLAQRQEPSPPPPPLPVATGNLQAVSVAVNGIYAKAKTFIKSEWTTKKIAIVGGAAGGALLLLLVLVIALRSKPSHSSGPSGTVQAKSSKGSKNRPQLVGSLDFGDGDSIDDLGDDTTDKPAKRKAPSLTDEELEDMTFAQIRSRLGQPSEVYRSSKKRNVGLAIWETGDNEYTVVGFIESIDGSNQTVVLTRHTQRPRSIVENMKRNLDKSLK